MGADDTRESGTRRNGARSGATLERLPPQARAEFERRCALRAVPAGTVLFEQGEPHTDTFLIRSGLVRTYYLSPLGKEITLAFWSDGNLVGGPDFFGATPHVWSARAVRDSRLLAIDGAELRDLARRFPDLAECMLDALTFKLHWLSVQVQNLATECVTDRLAHHLVWLGEMHGSEQADGIAIRHDFTQEDLAGMVGATRQWVSMTLNEFQRAGLVTMRKRHLVIRDLEALKRFGGHGSELPER